MNMVVHEPTIKKPTNPPETKIKYVSKTIYGKPELDELVSLGVDRSLASDILSKMKCIRPNDVGAVVAFDDNEKMVSIKLSEYNRIGEKKYQWIVLGLDNVPAVELSYEYNLSSELTSSTFSEWNGTKWNAITTRSRSYDNQGRLIETKENGKPLAKYIYTPNGNVREKLYYDKDKLVFRKVISRDVYDRPTKIAYYDSEKNGSEMYSTTLDFKSVQTNQVENASHNWHSVKSGGDYVKQNTYGYDYSGRLTSVSGGQNASYDFDALGRMVKKKEADTTVNYLYSPLFYRPAGMSVNDDSPSALSVYIQYDAAGNIWYDLHNKLVYKNGKNNMPSKVFLFSTMPQNITLDEVDALDDVNVSSPYQNDVTERIDIAYDEGGDRLWYSYNKLADGSGMTRVTLPGVGVYEAMKTNGVNGTFKLVRKDLVAGGYRDEAGNAHFPVMDAQGNVRGYATSDGIQSAYDYFAYGTVIDLSPDAGDDNKRWQDKEFDGEHGKYYFGARYFDPFFGMWMSPDPAGQFANPYTYGGDPVNFVDPNGEFAFVPVLIGAAIGAIVGGTTAYANCSGKDGCGWEALKMAGVGGAAGAAGGAAGAAFSGVSASAAGASGLSAAASSGAAAGSAGTSAAFAGGAVNGAISGFASSVVSYSLTTDSWNFGHFAFASLFSAFAGGLMGGLTDMFRYELSTEFQWETHEKVLNYGYSKYKGNGIDDPNVLENMVNYVQNIEGTNYSIEYNRGASGTRTATRASIGSKIIKIDANTGIEFNWKYDNKNGLHLTRSFSPSRFYSTIAHEIGHLDDAVGKFGTAFERLGVLQYKKNTPEVVCEYNRLESITELSAISKELNHRYSKYWSFNTKKYALDRFLKRTSQGIRGSYLSPWRFEY
jgi:RHS repeat-associated protein